MNLRTLAVIVAMAPCHAFIAGPGSNSGWLGTRSLTTAAQNNPSRLHAKPKRPEDNVDGVLYVNDKCINCAACANFSPNIFRRNDADRKHIVYEQPSTKDDILTARASMAACPVAAIRLETLAERRHRGKSEDEKKQIEEAWTAEDENLLHQMIQQPSKNGLELPFPRPFSENLDDIYYMGHHNEASFGATPYLVRTTFQNKPVWIMVDTPRFGKSSLRALTELTGPEGPDFLFLTHVDDTADHGKWVQEFPHLQRIFHQGDTGRHNWLGDKTLEEVEILLPKPEDSTSSSLHAYTLDGQPVSLDQVLQSDEDEHSVVILHTPGHSPGSITMWKRPTDSSPGVLFTGDTYAYSTRNGGGMSGFPRYGNNLQKQAETLKKLVKLDWDVIAPGHGHPRDYSNEPNKQQLKKVELEQALQGLVTRTY